MNADKWIGLRVARYRAVRGLTQQELADRVRLDPNSDETISRSYVCNIENGHKPVNTRRLLIGLADGLDVATTDLTGRPPLRRNGGTYELDTAIPAIRAALDSAEHIDDVPPEQLGHDIGRVLAARMACDYPTLAAGLPVAIARALRLSRDGGDDPYASNLLGRVLVAGSLAIRPLGYIDLATRMAEIAGNTAARVDDRTSAAAANFALAQCFLSGGVRGLRARSLALASQTAEVIEGAATSANRGWYVMLHLQAALAAASLGRDDVAQGHVGEAIDAVRHVSSDPWLMDINRANVGVWEVAVAIEGSNPDRAPELARQVNQGDLRTIQRKAHLAIHAGHGHAMAGNGEGAVRAFLAAERLAPAEIQGRARVREVVGDMLRGARREAGSPGLLHLAVRLGVDPLALDEGEAPAGADVLEVQVDHWGPRPHPEVGDV